VDDPERRRPIGLCISGREGGVLGNRLLEGLEVLKLLPAFPSDREARVRGDKDRRLRDWFRSAAGLAELQPWAVHNSPGSFSAILMAEPAIQALVQLDVRSRTSSFALKGRPRNMREVGAQLQADYILEGSVLRDGSQRGAWRRATAGYRGRITRLPDAALF
jgi:hypothetical protein